MKNVESNIKIDPLASIRPDAIARQRVIDFVITQFLAEKAEKAETEEAFKLIVDSIVPEDALDLEDEVTDFARARINSFIQAQKKAGKLEGFIRMLKDFKMRQYPFSMKLEHLILTDSAPEDTQQIITVDEETA